MYRIYTGIGSRSTPEYITDKMKLISNYLYKHGFILRSGGADGADMAFEWSVRDVKFKEIYLPWEGFNGNFSPLYDVRISALEIAAKYYLYDWGKAKRATKLLMGRNVYQVLGKDYNKPSDFIICYTQDGQFSGGTGLALKIAKDYNIPIYNLYYKKIEMYIFKIIDKIINRENAMF